MKALPFIIILVPFLVIGCAQATQVSPGPPTVKVARTLVVESIGGESNAVGRIRGKLMTDFSSMSGGTKQMWLRLHRAEVLAYFDAHGEAATRQEFNIVKDEKR